MNIHFRSCAKERGKTEYGTIKTRFFQRMQEKGRGLGFSCQLNAQMTPVLAVLFGQISPQWNSPSKILNKHERRSLHESAGKKKRLESSGDTENAQNMKSHLTQFRLVSFLLQRGAKVGLYLDPPNDQKRILVWEARDKSPIHFLLVIST